MSDGPHRSLPMRQHWKDLAKRAATPAFNSAEVGEAIPVALRREFAEAPLAKVREILGGAEQSFLFREDRAEQLEAARHGCRGSVPGNTLIDCAIEAIANGLTGDAAFKVALENALDAHARAGCHQIEEHWRREQPRNTGNVRARLEAARSECSYRALASKLISGQTGNQRGSRLSKRTGVDEGPPL